MVEGKIMNSTSSNDLDQGRARDLAAMETLALMLVGKVRLEEVHNLSDLRQLGYAAHLVKRNVDDPKDLLSEFSKFAFEKTKDLPRADVTYVDAIQERWAAEHYMSARKLRNELPLHIARFMKQQDNNST